jgi:hypothetical protein
MEWKDIGATIGKIAPIIGGAVGGPVGLAAGGALSLVLKAFGLSDDATPEQVKQVIESDPDASLKLMVAENEYRLKLREQEIDELRIILADVQSARTRQTDSEKATGKRDINLYVLAWFLVFVFFTLTGMLLYFSYNGKAITDQTGVLFMLLGTLSAAFGGVIQYFFGSSSGSAIKSEQMSEMKDKKR